MAQPKKKKRVTAKQVQASESKPFVYPALEAHPDRDEDAYEADGLTIRQRRFVEALVGPAGGNATKAAEMAGYAAENRLNLASTACENLRKPNVAKAVALAFARRNLDPEWAKQRLAELASSDMSNFVDVGSDGATTLNFTKAAERGALGQIKEYHEEGIDTGDGRPKLIKRRIKLHDPAPSLANLLKLFGLLVERHDHTTGGKPIKAYADIDDGEPTEAH